MTTRTRRGLSKPTLVLGTLLWSGVLAALLFLRQPDRGSQTASADEAQSVKLSFPTRRLPEFEFQKCSGGTLSLDDLKGRRWVASFVFSRCTSTCPMITAAVMKIHDRVQESAPDVHFVSITVDPKYDTPEVFGEFSKTFTRGDNSRWSFLTGGQQEIYELVVNGFGLLVKENLGQSRRPGFEVAHSNRVVLVNEDGIPVGTFLGHHEEDMVKLRRILTGQDEFPEPGPELGPALTFSTSDGSPISVELQAQPVNKEDSEQGSPNDSPEGSEGDAEQSASDSSSLSPVQHNAAIDLRLPKWARVLPAVNASLNTLAGLLLVAGLASIKAGNKSTHRNLMITAFLTSAVFLACYLTYHYALGEYTGEHGRRFVGSGVAAIVYQCILWPHIVLAVFVPLLAIRVFQHAFAQRWDAHRKLARITFPIWMFVSVTGVIIYGMLYHWPTA